MKPSSFYPILPNQLTVPDQTVPIRLDRFLAEAIPQISRQLWMKSLAECVRVDGHIPKKGFFLKGGETIEWKDPTVWDERASLDVLDETEQTVTVLKEDADFLVVEKPAGLPVHPLSTKEHDTLVQRLQKRYPEISEIGDDLREMGLVHRLDVDTSGLVLIARNQDAYRFLREEFKKRRVLKEYIAYVEGLCDPAKLLGIEGVDLWNGWFRIDLPIAHAQKTSKKMRVHLTKGRQAVTLFRIEGSNEPSELNWQSSCNQAHTDSFHSRSPYSIERTKAQRSKSVSFLRLQILTGVRHQIRVHLAFLGHPILGDTTYAQSNDVFSVQRLFLHASRLKFRHPKTLESIEVLSSKQD